ncbi:MAG: ABC transporter transmembrane domain-containing protein, partial [Luteolibacter sp.]
MRHSSPLGIAWKCVLPHKGTLAAAISWRVLSILAPLQIPVLTAVILDALAGEKPRIYGMPLSFEGASQALATIASALLAIAAVYASTRYARVATEARLSRGIVSGLKKRLFGHVTNLSRDQHQRFGGGDLLNRIIHDTGAVRSFITRVFVHAPTNVLQVAYPVVMLFFIDAFLAFVALAALIPQSIGTHILQSRLHRATRLRRQSKSDLTVAVKESLDEIESIQSLSAEKQTCLQFEATAERLEKDELRMSRLDGLIQATVWLTSGAALAVAWWIGGLQVLEGGMTIGTLVMFTGFVALVYQPFRFLTEMQRTYRTGIVAFERIQELLNAEPFVPAANGGYPIKIVDAHIEFREVSFTY